MKILIDIGHPAHIHLFKNFAWQMQNMDHNIMFTVREKEVTVQLLEGYKFDFICLSGINDTDFNLSGFDGTGRTNTPATAARMAELLKRKDMLFYTDNSIEPAYFAASSAEGTFFEIDLRHIDSDIYSGN